MAVQFSRGRPYDCEFCDITIMNGRLPRVKSPEQIVAELEALLRHGWSSGVATAMVGLLTALPNTRLYERLRQEGRIESESSGNNTDSDLNFTPRLDREFLVGGYRTLMRRLYEPRTYYRRCRTFLASYRPGGPRLTRPPRDLLAALRSLWRLGVRQRGRAAYWLFLWSTLLRRPRHISHAIELSIFGHHYRRVAAGLQ
jgi:hypothetical protein